MREPDLPCATALPGAGVREDCPAPAVPALFADRLPPPDRRRFVRMLAGKGSRFLARNLHTRTLAMRNTEPLVAFTFDDVPASGADWGAAILAAQGVRATFYVAGAGCGEMSPNGRLASAERVGALAAEGHEIGCHTYTHRAVGRIGLAGLAGEVERNGAFLKAVAGSAPRNFAFPYGDLSWRGKMYLERRFDSCRCDLRGVNTRKLDLGALKSIALDNASINRARIASLLRHTVRTKGWLIFSAHAVEADPGPFAVTPGLLSYAAAAAKAYGCRPVTIAAGLALVGGQRNGDSGAAGANA